MAGVGHQGVAHSHVPEVEARHTSSGATVPQWVAAVGVGAFLLEAPAAPGLAVAACVTPWAGV